MSFLKRSTYRFKKFSHKKWKKILIGRTPYQKVLRIYALIILIGALFLYFPFSRTTSQKSFNFFDACFTAVSAFTNTGLTTHTTSETFNVFGKIILAILIQIGGVGFMTVLIFLWIFIKKSNYNTEHRWFLHFERGSHKKVETLPVVKSGIVFLLLTELVGAFFLTIFFYFSEPISEFKENIDLKGNFFNSLGAGIFHSISAANNAGFDILGQHSIMPYRDGFGNLLSVVLLIESVIGGIGYPVFHDVYIWIKNKSAKRPTKFSLFSKIAISSYVTVAFFSLMLAIIFESFVGLKHTDSSYLYKNDNNKWGTGSVVLNKLWNLIYITFSSRSAGFASLNMSELSEPTKWLLSVLMFIGTSPASTGGGIRTVSVFIIWKKMFQMAAGKKYLTVYNKNIDQKIVFDAFNVFVLAVSLLVLSSFLIAIDLPHGKNAIGDVIFEASSAFGTAGLTAGVTSNSGVFGKLILMILMFIGQMGISNALIAVTNLKPKENLKHCSENVRIS